MDKLKTLKDIMRFTPEILGDEIVCKNDKEGSYICHYELKQEAIKWIKYARRCNHPLDMPETFKNFFNITVEDLK